MAHSVSGYVLYVSMWFNTKFVRVPLVLVLAQLFYMRVCKGVGVVLGAILNLRLQRNE